MAIFIHKNGQQWGPYEEQQVLAGLHDGTWSLSDAAWREGMAAWQPLGVLYPPMPMYAPPPPKRLEDDPAMRFILPVGRSIWAIAAGYLGLFSFIIFPAPIALIVSVIAIWDIQKSKANGNHKLGMGRAIFGLIMGVLGTGILLFALLSSLN